MSVAVSPSTILINRFNEYKGNHTNLKTSSPVFYKQIEGFRTKIDITNKLPTLELDDAVAKLNAFEDLEEHELTILTTSYNEIHVNITTNNAHLEELKVLIEAAITAKTVAAAAAKAAQDASTAAQAQALAVARQAVQTQIDALNGLIETRNTAFKEEVTKKTIQVLDMVGTDIPKKVDGIKGLLQGEHISQATRDMVEGIETDINDFKSNVDFKSITTPFKAPHETEIAGIQAQIDALTRARDGVDITAMQSALASNPLGISTTLEDFISAADAFIGTLNAKLGELDGAEAQVKAAIVVDKDKDIAVKRDIEVLLEDAKKVDDSVKLFVDKLDEAEKIVVRSPSFNVLLGALLGKAITTLEPFGRQVTEFNHRFQQINQKTNASYKSSDNYLALKKTIDGLNELYKAQQSKYDEINARYNSYKPTDPTPPSTLQTSTSAPRRPASASHIASAHTTITSQRRSTSADAAASGGPRQAFTDAQFKPIPYRPLQDEEEEDYLIEAADVKSEPVTPPAPIIGARRNFLYVSHNTEPKTAYLIVVKKPRVGESNVGGGGNKNYHVQKGGAPPPVKLPEGSEIFPIDVDNKGFGDVMAGLLPPSVLLTINPDGTGENPIITNIRGGRRLKGDRIALLYDKIKSELITDENQNPLTIGLRAVYYQNIIKLIRLLDFNLGHGGMSYEEMFEKLRKFMDFTDGTFGVLDALYKDTFHQGSLAPPPLPPISPPGSPPGSPRLSPRPPLKKIDSVLKKKSKDAKEAIKNIVGWTSTTENTNFNMLTKMFSKDCTHTGLPNKPNTFLNDDKKLGSNPSSYHKFRLNWIILLAFHSYYNNKSTLETVGRLIASLYNAFLGWLATSSYQDTFTRLFNKTLPIDPTTKYSEIFNKQLNASLNSENSSYKDVYTLVKNINDKMCELQDDMIPAIDVEHLEEYDDEMNDPDYVPPQEGDDSDDSNGDTSPRRREAVEELRLLSSSGVEPGERRLPLPPSGDPNPDRVNSSDSDLSDVDEPDERPKFTRLPKGQYPGAPLSDRTGVDRSHYLFSKLIGKEGVRGVSSLPAGPARPSSSPSQPQSEKVGSTRSNAVGTFNPLANKKAAETGMMLPQATELRKQQQGSQAFVITRPRKQLSFGLSYKPQAAPTSTPAALVPAPPSTLNPGFGRTSTSSLRRRLPGYVKPGGNNKKRTRKHKKHTSISTSRRPTRRRRIPPTEGHKYTRKRPRT